MGTSRSIRSHASSGCSGAAAEAEGPLDHHRVGARHHRGRFRGHGVVAGYQHRWDAAVGGERGVQADLAE
jgi:hypothetical protein